MEGWAKLILILINMEIAHEEFKERTEWLFFALVSNWESVKKELFEILKLGLSPPEKNLQRPRESSDTLQKHLSFPKKVKSLLKKILLGDNEILRHEEELFFEWIAWSFGNAILALKDKLNEEEQTDMAAGFETFLEIVFENYRDYQMSEVFLNYIFLNNQEKNNISPPKNNFENYFIGRIERIFNVKNGSLHKLKFIHSIFRMPHGLAYALDAFSLSIEEIRNTNLATKQKLGDIFIKAKY